MSIDKPWEAIFKKHNLDKHDFARAPYEIDSGQIWQDKAELHEI